MSLPHRLWSLLPRSARREALFSAMALLAPRLDRPAPDGQGSLTVAGFFTAATGLGSATRRLAEGLREAGLDPVAIDLTRALRQRPGATPPPPPVAVPEGPGTLLVHVNGPMLPWALFALGRRAVAGKRVIAVWNWELPELPADWSRGFRACHEIWVGSHFVAEACRRPGGPPVHVVPYPVPAPQPAPLGRAAFDLPPDAFVSLVVFDATSSLARKNPAAAITAHRLAFGDRPDRILVLKTHATAEAGPAWAALLAEAATTPNIRILDRHLSRAELWALMAASDVVLSLHRSEGFGFAIAEAMALGRAVVATGWSGNVDFMAGPGAFPVPYRLIPARDPQETYDLPGAQWADPDIAAAAAILTDLANRPGPFHPPAIGFPAPDYRGLLGRGLKQNKPRPGEGIPPDPYLFSGSFWRWWGGGYFRPVGGNGRAEIFLQWAAPAGPAGASKIRRTKRRWRATIPPQFTASPATTPQISPRRR